jgi:hypothetical protein
MESLEIYKLTNKSNDNNSTQNNGGTQNNTTQNNNGIISFDDLYQNYINYCHEKHFLIVNKKYFEKYVGYKLKDFVVFDTFIGCDWIIN